MSLSTGLGRLRGHISAALKKTAFDSPRLIPGWTTGLVSGFAVSTKPLARRTLRVSRIGRCSVHPLWLTLPPWIARPL